MKKCLFLCLFAGVSLVGGTGRLMAQAVGDAYMVISLSTNEFGKYPITYLSGEPAGGWTDEHKTDKLVLKRLPRNIPSFTNDFYIGVFEVTVGQFKQILPAFTPPVGADDLWPAMYVDTGSPSGFLSGLTADIDRDNLPTTNLVSFALPPAVQWEYACRAGSTNVYYYGDDASQLDDYAWYQANANYAVTNVGCLLPNAWGLYDMLGNAAELIAGGSAMRGGWAGDPAANCTCASSIGSLVPAICGFRVYLEVPTRSYTLTVTDGAGSGSYTNGHLVAIMANPPPTNKVFDCWSGNVATVADVSNPVTAVIMPGSNITVSATYRFLPYLTVVSGTGSGYYTNGLTVTVRANPTNHPWTFDRWTGSVAFADAASTNTTLAMPPTDATVTATYKLYPFLTVMVEDGLGGSYTNSSVNYAPGATVPISAASPPPHHSFQWSGNAVAQAAITAASGAAGLTNWNASLLMPNGDVTITATYPPIYYPLTVTGGSGSGDYTNGTEVAIAATAPPSAQHLFNGWLGNTGGVANPLSATTTVTISGPTKLEASYRPVAVTDRTFLVVDLTTGARSYTNAAPAGGWNTDSYKSEKLVLQKISAGTFMMGQGGIADASPAHPVTLTQAYYLGLFPVTQYQWNKVSSQWPSAYNGIFRDFRPVENISYATIRGASAGANWPVGNSVDSGFLSTLRSKTGSPQIAFDLPTEAQWEYACRAGTTGDYSFSGTAGDYMWYALNSAGTTQPVGQKLPNPWGFYDMHGNVSEWCLDWFARDYTSAPLTDPKGGPSSAQGARAWRGGAFNGTADSCKSAYRGYQAPTNGVAYLGLRLAWTVGTEYTFTVANGIVNTNGVFVQGVEIPITAEDKSPTWKFLRWDVSPAGTSLGASFNPNNANTIMTTPSTNVTLTALYQVNDGYTALTVINGTASETVCTNGTVVTITAGPPLDAMGNVNPYCEFDCWTGDTANVADVTNTTTTVTAAGGAVTLTATYKIMDPPPPGVHLLTTICNRVTKTVPIQEDATVTITAPPQSGGLMFGYWEVAPEGTALGASFNKNAATTTVTMPSIDVTLTAMYVKDAGPNPGFLNIRLVDSATSADLAGAEWGTDGKDWFPAAIKFPLKPGTYTLRFKPPNTNWLTPATVKVTIKTGQTTGPLTVPFTWVPVVTGVADTALGDPRDTVTLSPANGQVLPGKAVTLTAKPSSASVFVEWTDGEPAASRTVAPTTNATYTAVFRLKSSYTTPPVLPPPVLPPAIVPTVGTRFSYFVDINERPATFKATGLPPGLKINAATGEISGIPTKAGSSLTTVTATNPNKKSSSVGIPLTIAPLSAYAQGAFTGYLTNSTSEVIGTFTMTASATGALSVKVTTRGAAVSLSTKGWDPTDGVTFTAQFQTKKGEALSLSVDTTTYAVTGTAWGGKIGTAVDLAGQWDRFKVNKKLFPTDYNAAMLELARYEGYYTVALPVAACTMLTPGLDNIQEGAGFLTLTVNKKTGAVKVAGKLSDGTALSAAATLMVTGGQAVVPVFAPLYSKRGAASGLLTILPGLTAPDDNKVAPDAATAWQWAYPGKTAAATLDSFGATLAPFGAYYAKVASIQAYYGGAALTTAVDTVSMSIPLVFTARGAAALSADPTDNPCNAKLTVAPATGLFNGTFQRTPPGATKPVTVKYLGVLTQDALNNHVGCGAYVLPQAEKVGAAAYNLKPSYLVLIE